MSPARSGPVGSRRNSPGGFKPYTRGITPVVGPQTPQQQQSSMMEGLHDNFGTHVERPGFPTLAQYKMVEANYIQSLTPRRQGKALISQAMFDRIWDVLHQPDCQSETAQFRFWARKMFTISKTHRVTLGGGADTPDGGLGDGPQEVLLHDNLLVAIQEQLYDLLCYCHGSTGHGGRDKTCALIRKHYTWVPKDLVSNFIKACPTCIMKKCGGIENAAMAQSQILQQQSADSAARCSMMSASDAQGGAGGDLSLPSIRDYFPGMCSPDPDSPVSSNNSSPWSSVGNSSRDSPLSPLSSSIMDNVNNGSTDSGDHTTMYRDNSMANQGGSMNNNRTIRSSLSSMVAQPAGPALPPHLQRGMNGLPMSREVSLYRGIPNGWQFRHDTFAAAHAEFMRTKELGIHQDEADIGLGIRSNRPRIPSIAPLWGPNDFPGGPDFDHQLDDVNLHHDTTGHSISPLQQYASSDPNDVSNNLSLQYLLMSSPQDRGQNMKQDDYTPQIDPALLALSNDNQGQNQDQSSMHAQMTNENEEHGNLASSANFSSSNSIARRVMIPPRLNLQTLPTEKTIEALLAYRDNVADGTSTPDSPPNNCAWHLGGNPSPVSSISSYSSQISAFPALTRSTTATVSPASSSLPTPVDEIGKEGPNSTMPGGDMAEAGKGKDRMMMDDQTTYDLAEGIQVM